MSKIIMGIQLEHRQEAVREVQALLTEYGCYIRTRLGVHEASEDSCGEKGLIIIELVNTRKDITDEMEMKLKQLDFVTVKTMKFD